MAITNAQLAQQISELLDYWRTRDLQFAEWLSGSPSGGPYGDGRYPLSDYLGVIQYLYCPAALESGVTSSASSAALSAALAGASKNEALLARAAAEAARNQALTHRDDARAARDLALQYRDESASHMATADAYRTSAAASANAASLAETNAESAQGAAELARDLASGFAAAADASAVDAAASAAAAQTWNPANYAALAGATFTGPLRVSYNTPDLFIIPTDAPADNRLFRIRVNQAGQAQFGFLSDDLQSGTNWLTVNRSGIVPTVAFAVPLSINTSGTGAAGRNTEFKTAGQPLAAFGSYSGAWRPSITIQGQTKDHYLFVVGPDSVDTASNTDARIHSSRGLIISSTTSYHRVRNSNGILFQTANAETDKGYVYHDAAGFGLLGSPGGWAVHIPQGTNRVEIPGADIRSDYYYGRTDPGTYIGSNHGSFTYGSMFVGGARGGYVGLIINDGVRYPTLMSSGGSSGIYNQAGAYWDYYNDGTRFRIGRHPYQDYAGSGGALLHLVAGQGGGRVFVQQGGSPAGNTEGDITLIW